MADFDLDEIPLPGNSSSKGSSSKKKVKLKRIFMEDKRSSSKKSSRHDESNPPKKAREPKAPELFTPAMSIRERIQAEMEGSTSRDKEDSRARSDIVDEMFRDFLAQKMQQVEKEHCTKKQKPDAIDVSETLNKSEVLKWASTDSDTSKSVPEKKSKRSSDSVERESKRKKKEHKSRHSSTKRHREKKLGSTVVQMGPQLPPELTVSRSTSNGGSKHDKSSMHTSVKEEEVPLPKGGVQIKTMTAALKNLTNTFALDEPLDLLLVSGCEPDSYTQKSEVSEEKKQEKSSTGSSMSKKPVMSLKISLASASLISSGTKVENETGRRGKKKKQLEEGEVLSSGSEDSTDDDDSDSDDDDNKDDDSKKEGNDDNDISETGSITDSDDVEKTKSKSKKKKKHKHKHKSKKKKKKSSSKNGSKSKKKKSHRSRSTSRSPTREDPSLVSERFYRGRSPVRVEKKWVAEKGKPMVLYTRSYRERHGLSDGRSRSRSPHEREKDKRRDRSRERSRERERDKYKDRERDPEGDRKKTTREEELQIDKAKLRKIAIANAVHMMKSGGQMKFDSDSLAKLKAGGKSVSELTDYCKKISDKEKVRREKYGDSDLSDSSEDYQHSAKSEDEDFTIHHPFSVKEAPNIVMNIRNSKQLPVLTPQEKVTEGAKLRLTFPVSSGSQHRAKESEWVPVEKTTAPPTNTVTTVATLSKLVTPATTTATTVPSVTSAVVTATATTGSSGTSGAMITTAAEVAMQVAAAVPDKDKVFPDPPSLPIDIGSIVSERLAAVRKLQQNPNDVQAISQMRKAQMKASQWAESKVLPGQFLGSTGATIMSQQELMGPDKKRQAWAKKDQLTMATPVSGGIGMLMLQRLGWKQGEGLGKNKDGPQQPLLLDVKIDRKGLISQDESHKNVKKVQPTRAPIRDLSGKHPVSALVELCSKRRWESPEFILVQESGPPHKKNFLFKAIVNKVEYISSLTSNNKKQAKAQAATICLQELGLVPR